jgi:putative chitinase
MTMTIEQLLKVVPLAGRARAAAFLVPLNKSMPEYGITTLARRASFMAQIAHESGQLSRVLESLHYRQSSRLMEVWPKRFRTVEATLPYLQNAEALGNLVYADRMGNGDVASGDGFRFRGRGLIQTTGRANYADCGKALGIDLLAQPELLETPEYAVRSACWFWLARGLNALADAGDQGAVTERVNGGKHGLAERLAFFRTALQERI